jgi:predicted amidohydrolase
MTGAGADPSRPADLVRVAVLQMSSEPGAVTANVDGLVALVEEHGPQADLLVAPELATTGYDLQLLAVRGPELAEPADGPTGRRLQQLATQLGTTVVFGFLERHGDHLYDSLLTVSPEGPPSVYRKSHLYPPELAVFTAGNSLGIVATPAGVVGPLLCFEHAFPEVATTLALAGAQILVIPSAVPLDYEHVLHLRTRARAQDNQVFAIGCNMSGHGFAGRSLVADPRGEVLSEAGEEPTVLVVDLDLASARSERGREPALQMRRPELYFGTGPGR